MSKANLFTLGAHLRHRLIQRIAKFTVGSLISTLFITGAGVGVGLVTAPAANAALTCTGTASVSVKSYTYVSASSSIVSGIVFNVTPFTYSGETVGGYALTWTSTSNGNSTTTYYSDSYNSTTATFDRNLPTNVITKTGVYNFFLQPYYLVGATKTLGCVQFGTGGVTLADVAPSITTAADGAVDGTAFTTQPQITIRNKDGSAYTTPVTVTATSSAGTISNASATSNSSGVATFSGLTISSAQGTATITYSITVSGTTSQATQQITVNKAPSTPSPTISGTAQVGQTLTASATSTGTPTPTISYQWLSASTSGGTYSAISGATASTYTLVNADAGQYIKVQATSTNGISPDAVGTSAATSQVTQAPTVSTPTISGTKKVGSVLTASATATGTPSPSIAYQWFSASTSSGTYSAISGATNSTYTIVSADLNQYIKVQATASNGVAPNAVDTSTATTAIAAADLSYSVDSATSLAGANSTVFFGYTSASETTITLYRVGSSGSDPEVPISVTGGSWTVTAGTGTSISGSPVTFTSGSVNVTLTSATGSLTLARNIGGSVGTETATVNSTTPRTFAVTVEADTPDTPSVSETVTANVSFTVKWNRPTKIGSGALSSYTLTVSPPPSSDGPSFTVTPSGGSTESYTVNNLSNGTEYTFTITATNNGGKVSNAATTRGKPSWVPAAPAKPIVTAYTDTATITWTAPNNNGETITAYTVESSTVGSSTWYTVVASTTLTSIEVSGLTGKSNLVYRVSATNARGQGANSASSDAITPGKSNHSLTASPSVSKVNFGSSDSATVTTSSSAGADFDTGDSSFSTTLNYEVSDNEVCEISGNSVRPKSGGKSGSCLVTAKSSGNSKYNPSSATPFTFTVDPIEPDDPDTSTVTTTSSSIVVNWNTLATTKDGGNGGSGVQGYILEYSNNSGGSWIAVVETQTVLTGTISSLSPDTSYLIRLKAVNNGNKSSAGRSFTAKTNAATKSARSLALSGGSGINFGQSLTLSKTGTDSGTTRWTTNDSSICTVDSTGIVTSVGAGSCTVSFIADEDATYQSETATSTFTISAVDPSAPTLSEPSAGEESITLSWAAPTSKGGAASITGYTVTSSPAGFGCTTTGATTCTITGLNSSTTYTFTITATSSSGKTSVVSGSKSGKPNAKTVSSSPSSPAPIREVAPVVESPKENKEPERAAPKSNEILPAVKLPNTNALPPATALPSRGNIVTLKNGKEEIATLTIIQEPVTSSNTQAATPDSTLKTTAEIKGNDWGISVQSTVAAAPNPGGGSTPSNPSNGGGTQLTFDKGYTAQTQGNGFAPRTTVAVYIFSDPILIGKIRTDSNGNFRGRILVPRYLQDGIHTLQLNGTTKNLEVRTASIPVVVRTKYSATRKTTPVAPAPAPAAPEKIIEVPKTVQSLSTSVTFGMSGWWINSKGYDALRKIINQLPPSAQEISVTVVGNAQLTKVNPYPNIGLDRAKAVAKAMQKLGFKAKYSVSQSNEPGLTTAEYRRADITISWKE